MVVGSVSTISSLTKSDASWLSCWVRSLAAFRLSCVFMIGEFRVLLKLFLQILCYSLKMWYHLLIELLLTFLMYRGDYKCCA